MNTIHYIITITNLFWSTHFRSFQWNFMYNYKDGIFAYHWGWANNIYIGSANSLNENILIIDRSSEYRQRSMKINDQYF